MEVSMEENDNVFPVKSRILIQPDWDTGAKSWLMVKTPGQSSLRGVFSDADVAADGFTVQKHRRTLISVSHPHAGYTALFVAPSYVWPHVHASKSVVSLDVTEGGLGVSSSVNGELNVWTSVEGEVRRRLEGHIDSVYCARFFPSGTILLTGGADFRLKIWSAETGACAATIVGHRGAINDVAILDRGRNVVSASRDGTVKLWDVGRSHCLHSFDEQLDDGLGVVNAIALGVADPLSGGNGAATSTAPVTEGEPMREVGTEGKFLIVAAEGNSSGGGGGGKLAGLVLKSRERFFQASTPSPVNACLCLSDRTFAYGLQDGTVAVVDVRNCDKNLHVEKESRGAVLSMAPFRCGFLVSTQDGSVVYVPKKMYNNNNNHDVASSSSVMELTGPECDPVYKVVGQGRNVVYTACRDGNVRKYLIDETLVANVES